MANINARVKTIEGIRGSNIPMELLSGDQPLILKGVASDWPLVVAGRKSIDAAIAYLRSFYANKTVTAFIGTPEIGGRYFYNEDLSQLNFKSERVMLDGVLDAIQQAQGSEAPPSFYVGSTTLDVCFPGLRAENDLKVPAENPLVSIWMGNRSRIACHFDAPDNLACSVVGRRRFTVFPPEQIANLYPGPIDFNPAGQQISLVDFSNPDYQKFPRFQKAESAGQIADLEPGDALYLPSMWWHHVEGFSDFNVLVNYWWRQVPGYMGPGLNVLKHAMLGLRDIPEREKTAWKALFDYYIFGDQEQVREHIPPAAQDSLAPMDDLRARQVRAWLLGRLNR